MIIRYTPLAACKIQIPRVTPQSPPLDDWYHLELIGRRRTLSRVQYLFPITSAGIKLAANVVAGL